jgi:hypothetical protein
MFGVTTSDDYKPVAWMGRYPIRLTTILCAIFVLGMFGTVFAQTAKLDLTPFEFRSWSFFHGAIWQPFTSVLLQNASFFFLFNIVFLYWSGVEVEKFLGRRRYLELLGLLLLVPPVVLTAWGLAGMNWNYFGPYELTVGMFIAFATLYPNLELFGWVTLKWLAFAGILLGSMQYLPNHQWGNISVLWGMCLTAFLYIRYLQRRAAHASSSPIAAAFAKIFRRKPRFQVVSRESASRVVEPDDVYASVDPILDKIAKSGIGSLTASERRALDRARNRLLKKSK